jgi:mRNA-degrading endonuclease HigB of HigAB toxin-antitoxin module
MLRLIGREKLMPLRGQNQETARWVAHWSAELRDAHWKRPTDIAHQFPKAKQLGNSNFLFPIPKQKIAIHLLIAFPQGVALIIAITVFEAANGH